MNPGKELYSHIPDGLRFGATKVAYTLSEATKIRNPDMFTGIDVAFTDWCNRGCFTGKI